MNWSIEESRLLYHMVSWSDGYIDINNSGQVCVIPSGGSLDPQVDLYELTKELQDKGLKLPVLIRFSDILKSRVKSLIKAFDKAMLSNHYDANYIAVYPIKVNQQRRVIEDIVSAGEGRVGLEAGSKPELLINIALASKGSIIICNGYKDREYIRLAIIANQLGFQIYIVIEKLSELSLIIECVEELKVVPLLGFRVRLLSITNGRWQNTGGEKSKFGLRINQVLKAVEILRKNGILDKLKLLHFHIGSQVAESIDLKKGFNEGARFYAQLKKMFVPIDTIDIGGGLGVDYEGTKSTSYNSINYTIDDYANIAVSTIKEVCELENIPLPSIITESGRAMTAHHVIMVTNIIDVEEHVNLDKLIPNKNACNIINEFCSLLDTYKKYEPNESYEKIIKLHKKALRLFSDGKLNLEQYALADEIYNTICIKLFEKVKTENKEHKLIDKLSYKIADKYFANFSVFQTVPDSWAINQVFPILPLQRLLEKPDKRCTLQDLTCDSDGIINKYVDSEGVNTTLPVHSLNGEEPYMIGIFLLGAYQEILGDIHNLFGDSSSVNVELDADGNYKLTEFDAGDKVSDLFQTIHIDPDKFEQRYSFLVDACEIDADTKNLYFEQLLRGLEGYTYLED